MKDMKYILKEFHKKEWLLTACSIGFILIQVWMDLNLPAYMSRITLLSETRGTAMQDILKTGGEMLLFALGSLCASCMTAVCISALSADIGGNLRKGVFHQVMQFSMAETDRFSPASLITRSTNDITQVQTMIVMGLQVIVKAPVTAIGAIGKMSDTVWQWTAVTVIGTVLIIGSVTICAMIILPHQKKVQKRTDDITRIADESLSGMEVIHAYNAENTAEEKFSDVNADLTKNNLSAIRTMAFLSPDVQLILNGMTLAIYWIGAVLISQTGTMQQAGLFAGMLAFAQYAVQIVNAFVSLTMVFTMIPKAMVSLNRISEVLKTSPSVKDSGNVKATESDGTLSFDHVDFCYPGEEKPTIRDISFQAEPGETLAIIGSTGSGKSTVVNLIPRFYDPTHGEIRIDGVNIRDYSLKDLREKIGYCSQQAVLLSGTVQSNISCGSSVNEESMEKALKTSQSESFVEKMDGKENARIMQEGSNLSGGQKQRLSIARALAKSPEILILDDSTSALDYETERNLRRDLSENYSNTTKIIITQRIGNAKDADEILVMDQGKIVGKGKHEDLMKNCQVYRQIAQTQSEEAAL